MKTVSKIAERGGVQLIKITNDEGAPVQYLAGFAPWRKASNSSRATPLAKALEKRQIDSEPLRSHEAAALKAWAEEYL